MWFGIHPGWRVSSEESRRIAAAVAETEKTTSAEIKVVVVRHCWHDLRRKALELFRKHGLDKTEQRNAVMILVVTANREFLIYGDRGIHERVRQAFWDDVRDRMSACFREGRYADGICEGVQLAGVKLTAFFPIRPDDKNEIANEVVFEK
jgi:uncharacterized membrane protein